MYKNTIILGSILSLIILVCCVDEHKSSQEEWIWDKVTNFGSKPLWSPDGMKILFGDDRPGRPGLYIWDLVNEPIPLLDSLCFHNWDYCWSPTGDRVAFTSPGGIDDSTAGVWIVNISDLRKARVYDRGRNVTWRSSGDKVVIRLDNPISDEPGIYEIDLNSNEVVKLFSGGFKPICSPQGYWLAYNNGEIRGQLFVSDSSRNEHIVTEMGALQWAWSADGHVLYAVVNDWASGDLTGMLWRINLTGDNIVTDSLTRWSAYPAPNKDGSEAAFLRMSNGLWSGLWIYRQPNVEIRIAGYGLNPSFNPTSDRIAVNLQGGGIRILRRK